VPFVLYVSIRCINIAVELSLLLSREWSGADCCNKAAVSACDCGKLIFQVYDMYSFSIVMYKLHLHWSKFGSNVFV